MHATPNAPADTAGLERAVADLDPLLAALEKALEYEASALGESGGGAALLDAATCKQQALREFESSLQQQGVERSIRSLSAAATNDLAEAPWWQKFCARLRHCRGMNLAAGSAIALAQRQTRVGLELLGQSSAPSAYDQRGQAGATPTSRNLASC
ncbi:MAG: hypothetical protein EA417_03230 [Gammaproteobacteria bacterium]|nr:MAG: hypothetical protein EA417_03230 [Gammaproteobacteria bacterium]